jgi:signal transduction histidine kinase
MSLPTHYAPAPPALPDPGTAASGSSEPACRRAWRLLCDAGPAALVSAGRLARDPALADALQDAFNAGRVPGALIEAEIRRALLDGPSDATLLAGVLLAAVALDRFGAGRRALLLAEACAGRARRTDAGAVAGAVLRAHATLVLARSTTLRDAALLQAEACRAEVGRPDTLARSAVLWTGVRLLCGAPLAELQHYAQAVRQAIPAASGAVATCQLDGRIALFRTLAGTAQAPFAPRVQPQDRHFGCWLGCLQAAWLRGDIETAGTALAAARRLLSPLTPPCELLPYHLFGALTLARLPGGPDGTAALRGHRRALREWAGRAPDLAGAMAQLALAAGQDAAGGHRALGAYEQAAALARGQGQAWIAALAWEGAAGLCGRLGLAGAQPGYRRLALDAWRDWGAHGRVRDLMQAWDAAPDDQRTRAARADTVGELGITIAHEVNQPLAAILLHAAAARRWLRRAEPDTARALEALEQISACGRQAGDIVRSVRCLARREGEAATTFVLDAAVGDVALLLRALMVRQNVLLETRLQLKDRQIHASRAQIQQILINLLLNAIEALADVRDRPRRIVLESVLVSAPDGTTLVELRVRDNGPGIAPADRERIFEALYSTKPHGTGVGLSISRAIARAHGGHIECVPALPHGALFRVVLPVRCMAAAPPSETRDHA